MRGGDPSVVAWYVASSSTHSSLQYHLHRSCSETHLLLQLVSCSVSDSANYVQRECIPTHHFRMTHLGQLDSRLRLKTRRGACLKLRRQATVHRFSLCLHPSHIVLILHSTLYTLHLTPSTTRYAHVLASSTSSPLPPAPARGGRTRPRSHFGHTPRPTFDRVFVNYTPTFLSSSLHSFTFPSSPI